MEIQPYRAHELRFAYCYRVYVRFRTYRCRPIHQLALLDESLLGELLSIHNIRVLECASDATDLLSMVSLQPSETISGCASKLKGRVSKWLLATLRLGERTDLLSKGYFACTTGKSTREAVDQYLNTQGEHHGYTRRRLPPIFVEQYPLNEEDNARISPKHAMVISQFHLVMSTFGRQGVFGSHEGAKIAAEWRRLQVTSRFALLKVSFVPDHVHVAVRAHPAVSPGGLVASLMNSAQRVFTGGLGRLWQPSAYIGSFGDLASPQISRYIRDWPL